MEEVNTAFANLVERVFGRNSIRGCNNLQGYKRL